MEGSYSQLAAEEFFGRGGERLAFVGLRRFDEVIQTVEQGRADYAMLPVENTTSGSVNDVYDLLLHTRLSIVGEKKFRVRHCLVACEDVPLSSIRKIWSHPQPVAQCSHFLAGLKDVEITYFDDTAMSASLIAETRDPSQAGISSERAAEMFGLKILARDFANHDLNFTRFLVAARNARAVDPRIPCKTSLVMATGQRAGSLVEALLVFRDHGLNLTKLESRPIPGNPWEEMFYVDFDGNIAEAHAKAAIDELMRLTRFIKVLGSYPAQDLPRTSLPTEAVAEAPTAVDAPPVEASDRLTSRAHKPDETVIDVGDVRIGGDGFVVLAGPAWVESQGQILACAREAKERGAAVLRGGCFEPPTSPDSFHGLGFEGLELLAEAGRRYGMPILTEVLSIDDLARVVSTVDVLRIGARNMHDFALLGAVGRVHRPVMLERGEVASIEELLRAAEHILAGGNQQVILCERGIRTVEASARATLDLSAVPILRGRTHLPVVVDPMHAAETPELVCALARAARAVGAHGILLGVQPEAEDGSVSLDFPRFASLMAGFR